MKNNLRVERARVRMTQQELADKTGVTRQTIVAIEQGKFNPSTVLALKMARVFGVTIEALFELEDGTLVVPFVKIEKINRLRRISEAVFR